MRKKLIATIVMAVTAMSLAACGAAASEAASKTETEAVEETKTEAASQDEPVSEAEDEDSSDEPAATENADDAGYDFEMLTGKHYVLIGIKDKGDIFVEIDADAAPISASNFMDLVNKQFYDGLTFHRIINGFMMQGGDPMQVGKNVSERTIKGEFASNGVENNISHVRGTISMARAMDPDSASSQFFIVHQDSTYLDGEYAGFGTVINGMEIVDDICENAIVTDNNGSVAAPNQPVIEYIVDVTYEYEAEMAMVDEFIPSNEMEVQCGKDIFESYDDVIANLKPGMGYAYVKLMGVEDDVLLICTESFEQDGKNVTMTAYPYFLNTDTNEVTCGSVLYANNENCPVKISSDNCIITMTDNRIEVSCSAIEYPENPGIMILSTAYKDGDVYGGFIRDTNSIQIDGDDIAADDAQAYADHVKMYEDASVIEFTIIE